MAVGYHKLNSSAARARRKTADSAPAAAVTVTRIGTFVSHPEYGQGETLEEFVADSDRVRCRFHDGREVELRGWDVRVG